MLLTIIQFLLPLVTVRFISRIYVDTQFYSNFLKHKVAVSNALIFSKLRDRLNQFNSMEMNDKRKADVQRMKRYEKKSCELNLNKVFIQDMLAPILHGHHISHMLVTSNYLQFCYLKYQREH